MPGTFMKNPRYQRAMKRLRRLGPNQRAVLSSSELLNAIGNEEGRRQLQYMNLGEQRKARLGREKIAEGQLSLGKSRLDLRKDILDYDKKQGDTAEMFGWANVGMGGLAGWMDLKEKETLAGKLDEQTAMYRKLMASRGMA